MYLKIAAVMFPFLMVPCRAQFFDPLAAKEYTQILNHGELMYGNTNAIRQRLEMYTEMIRQSKMLTSVQKTAAYADIKEFASAAARGVQFSVDNLDAAFRKAYPGFGDVGEPYPKRYDRWAYTLLETLYGASNASGASWRHMQGEQSTILNLQSEAMNTDNQQKALMMNSAIGLEGLSQSNKLREAMLATMQADNAKAAFELQKDMAREQMERQVYAPVGIRRDNATFSGAGGDR